MFEQIYIMIMQIFLIVVAVALVLGAIFAVGLGIREAIREWRNDQCTK